jgi:hypothetical protein
MTIGPWIILPSFSLIIVGKFVYDAIDRRAKMERLAEIADCPFKFRPFDHDNIVVQLTADTTLWCDYTLGIRSDGVYGIKRLRLLGINKPRSGIWDLKIGQSIFPIIKAVDEFVAWTRLQSFKTNFHSDFELEWDTMKKNLDNLAYLESEVKKKEGK